MKLTCLKPLLAPAKCTASHGWKADEYRGSRHARGYGYAWEKLRAQALDRDNGLCVPCTGKGRVTIATQVDHRTAKAQGGTDDLSNLQSICDACHREKTAREDSKHRGGM